MNKYSQEQIDLVIQFGDQLIKAIDEQMEDLTHQSRMDISEIIMVMNRLVFPKNNVNYRLVKKPDIQKDVELRTCSRDNCNNQVATKASKLCQEHKDERVKSKAKVIKKCQVPDCEVELKDGRMKLCPEHKKQPKELPNCKHDGCKLLVATAKSKYCINHKRKSLPQRRAVAIPISDEDE